MKQNLKNNFIIKAELKHEKKYDYSLVNYTNAHVKVEIICPIHGIFLQKPNQHLMGNGCPKCIGRSKTINEYIKICGEKHNNKYDYSLVNQLDIDNDNKISIICPEHGIFNQKSSSHLFKRGCPKCGGSLKLTTEDFIEKANQIHGYKYDYSLVNYNGNKLKVEIICPEHGNFTQRANSHLNGQGCPICKESKGEKSIRYYLLNKGINFSREKKFKNCINEKLLPFDFYLPDYNICIEYDGKQHFEPVERFGGINGFKKIKENDSIKNIFCENNSIDLIRISYKENIYDILNSKL